MLDLRSDNTAPIAPEVMDALARANEGHDTAYGADGWSQRLKDELARVFETDDLDLVMAITGTGANALALSIICPAWGAVVCHPLAHVVQDECNAPLMFTGGASWITVGEPHGRLGPDDVASALDGYHFGSMHSAQPKVLLVAQASERGLVWSLDEMRAFGTVARRFDMHFMLDGARFANALARTGASPADLSWRAGVDALVFGMTKNGGMAAELILLFGKARSHAAPFLRKRSGQVQSKGRYLAAQAMGALAGGRWLERAAHANAMATRLAEGLVKRGARLLYPVEANLVFAQLPPALQDRLAEKALFYPGYENGGTRLVASWSTSADDIDRLLASVG
ncbi:MAG TPA: beta-eliminating lyase-related protein [Geminicoccus sp.]|uniref:threonine aldolase family protein n=1 Tax=Geminicoccus sp. TaxID=2024832 RepID=UPI002E32C9BF|nr:beta-eliminating lyase-related protein [Geminicoccus sp.]HEX2526980.1 beta-eliminating lyase-related protein [Geminicoccus sp.]